MVARKKTGRGGVTTNSHQSHHVEDKRRRSLGSNGWDDGDTKSMLHIFYPPSYSVLLSSPNIGIERQKISRRDAE